MSADVFGILHGAENRVGATVQHDVERAKVTVTFVPEREQNNEHGGDQLHQQHGSDEAKGDAASSECACDSHAKMASALRRR